MSEEKKYEMQKYPKPIVGIFIFNDKNELFLMKSPKWENNYSCPGGGIEINEPLIEAAKREAKEETNLDISDVKFFSLGEGLNLGKSYDKKEKHLIFLSYTAEAKKIDEIVLNEESVAYKWLPLDEWLKKKNISKGTREVIEKLNIEKPDYKNMYLRALADYQNLVKQAAEEKRSFIKYSTEQFLHEIIPVYDNLKISIGNLSEAEADNAWVQGVKYVIKQFREVLENSGVEEIETEGQVFDHNIMDAVEGQGEKVIKQVKSGYKLNGKVIIAAKVVVG